MSIFPLLALAGGGAAVAISKGETPDQTKIGSVTAAVDANPGLGNSLVSGAGATLGQLASVQVQTVGGASPKAQMIASRLNALSKSKLFESIGPQKVLPGLSSGNASNPEDPQIKEKLDAINSYAQQAYDRLDPSARYEGAQVLNQQLNLDPPLTGNESWETIASVAGGATGAAVGAYIGGPLGAKIGAMVGAYLGVKLEELLSKDMNEIGDWFSARWSDITNWVGDEASSAESSVGDFLGSIF